MNASYIHEQAYIAGINALRECKPTPMVVEQHLNFLDDKSPVTKSYFVEGGPCGFASIIFKANTPVNKQFLNGLKKADLAGIDHSVWSKRYTGGFSYWVSEGGQSLQRKEVFAKAFNKVLRENGITSYVSSRMD
jgi:hypothetical protein